MRLTATCLVFGFAVSHLLGQVGMLSAEDSVVRFDDIALSVPAEWKQEPPSNRLRLGQFRVPAVEPDTEGAELVVSFFGGDGGGIDPNLIRWVNEFAADGRKSKVMKGKSEQGTYYLTDLTGTFNKRKGPFAGPTTPIPGSRALGVILQIPEKGNYFLKLTGPEKTVTAAEEAFRKSFGGNAEEEAAHELPAQ